MVFNNLIGIIDEFHYILYRVLEKFENYKEYILSYLIDAKYRFSQNELNYYNCLFLIPKIEQNNGNINLLSHKLGLSKCNLNHLPNG